MYVCMYVCMYIIQVCLKITAVFCYYDDITFCLLDFWIVSLFLSLIDKDAATTVFNQRENSSKHHQWVHRRKLG